MGNYNKEVHILVRADANTSGLGKAEKDLNNLGNAIKKVKWDAFGFRKKIEEGLFKGLDIEAFKGRKLAEAQRTLANFPSSLMTSTYAGAKKAYEQAIKVKGSLLKKQEQLGKLDEKAAKGKLGKTDQNSRNNAIRLIEKYRGTLDKRLSDFTELRTKYKDLRQKRREAEKAVLMLDKGEFTPKIKEEIDAATRERAERRNNLAKTFFSENVHPYLTKWGHATDFKKEREMLVSAQMAMRALRRNFKAVPPTDSSGKEASGQLNLDFLSASKAFRATRYFDSFISDYGKYRSGMEELKKNVGDVLASKDPVTAEQQMGVFAKKAYTLGLEYSRSSYKLKDNLKKLGDIPGQTGEDIKTAMNNISAYTSTLKTESKDIERLREIFEDKRLNTRFNPLKWGNAASMTTGGDSIRESEKAASILRHNHSKWDTFITGPKKNINSSLIRMGFTVERTSESPENLGLVLPKWGYADKAFIKPPDAAEALSEIRSNLPKWGNTASMRTGTFASEWGQAANAIIHSPEWNMAFRQNRRLSENKPKNDFAVPQGLEGGMEANGPQITTQSKNHIIVPPEFGGGTGGNRPQRGLAHALWGGEPVNLRQIIHGIRNPIDENGEAIKNIENSTFWYAMSDATRQIGHVAWRNTLNSAQVSMNEFLQFEGAMTDILKHFAGLRNEKTNLPNERYYAMRDKIISMSKDLPLSQTDIALAAGRAARMGIDEPDLLRNVELATKLGVGFNMSPDAVMESIAKIAASSGISPSDNKSLMRIGDAINYLDDHTNATGEDIFEFLKDSTAGGKTIGLSVGETAAIGTALMSLGTNPSVAKTAFKNLMLIATSGPRNQKKGERYLSYAGIENEEMMKRMRANPRQGLLWILEKLAGAKNNEVGKDTASIIRFVTGQQSALPTMKLTSREGIDTLKRLFDMLDNAAGGWTEKEYETKMKADPNREMALLENALKELRIEFGKNLFPAVKEFAPVVKDVMRNVGGFMANNPKLVQGMVGGGLAIGASANAMATISDAMIIFDAIRRAGGFKNLKSLSGMFTALSPLLAIQTNQVLPTIGAELTNLWGALKGGGKGLAGLFGGAWHTMTAVPLGEVPAIGTAAGVGGAAILGTLIGSQIWKYIDENYIIPKQQAEAKAEAESGTARKGRARNIVLERAHKSRLEAERASLERYVAKEDAENIRRATMPADDYDYYSSSGSKKVLEARERLDKVRREIAFSEARIAGARARAQVLPTKAAPDGVSDDTRNRWTALNKAGADWTEQRQYWEQRKSFYDASFANNPSLRENEATMGNYGDIQNKLREIKAFQQEIQNQSDALVVKAMEEQKKYFADFRMMNESWAKADKDRWDNATVRATASLQEWVLHSQDAGGKMKNSFDPVLDSFNAKLDAAKTHLRDIKTLAESMKNLNINININGQAPAGKGGAAIPIGGGKTGVGKGGGSFPMSLPGSMGMSFLLDSPTANNQTYNSTANITINNNTPSSQIAVNQWARQLGGILGGANRQSAVYA